MKWVFSYFKRSQISKTSEKNGCFPYHSLNSCILSNLLFDRWYDQVFILREICKVLTKKYILFLKLFDDCPKSILKYSVFLLSHYFEEYMKVTLFPWLFFFNQSFSKSVLIPVYFYQTGFHSKLNKYLKIWYLHPPISYLYHSKKYLNFTQMTQSHAKQPVKRLKSFSSIQLQPHMHEFQYYQLLVTLQKHSCTTI